jgi:hypothetical protein
MPIENCKGGLPNRIYKKLIALKFKLKRAKSDVVKEQTCCPARSLLLLLKGNQIYLAEV